MIRRKRLFGILLAADVKRKRKAVHRPWLGFFVMRVSKQRTWKSAIA